MRMIVILMVFLVSCSPKEEETISNFVQKYEDSVIDLDFKLIESELVESITYGDSINELKTVLFDRNGESWLSYWIKLDSMKTETYLKYKKSYDEYDNKYYSSKDYEDRTMYFDLAQDTGYDLIDIGKERDKARDNAVLFGKLDSLYRSYLQYDTNSAIAYVYEVKYSIFNNKLQARQTFIKKMVLNKDLSRVYEVI